MVIAMSVTTLTACARSQVGAGGVRAGNTTIGWGRKEVVAKREPEALVARDGTICRVAPDRFKDTTVGTVVDCNWQ